MTKKGGNLIECEVAIVGGGMVGSALACALGQYGIETCLIEAYALDADWTPERVDNRVSALTRTSQTVLRNLGAWDDMVSMRVSPYTHMHVWDADGFGAVDFDAADLGEPELGHIVENRVTQLALWRRLHQLDSVRMLWPHRVEDLHLDGDRPELRLGDGGIIRPKVVVAADGRDSQIRKLAGISIQGWTYDQHAIVGTVRTERPHAESAFQRFMPTGPLAFLPINDGHCSIVWSTSPERARRLMAEGDEAFCMALTEASEERLGQVLEVSQRAVFPLRLQHAEPYVLSGLALVGDAAHAVHPLAGRGVNLGLLDAATLAEVLAEGARRGEAIGSLAVLRRYQRQRKGPNLRMLAAMDGFKRLFSNDSGLLKLVRDSGMNVFNLAGPVKQLVARQAMGLDSQLDGELPALARMQYD